MRLTIIVAAAALAMPAAAQTGKVKIGFVNTFSGPKRRIGNDEKDGFELALDHLGRKMAGLHVDVVYEDDQMRPDVGKQASEKAVRSRARWIS